MAELDLAQAGTVYPGYDGALAQFATVGVFGGTLDLGGRTTPAGTVVLDGGTIANGTLQAGSYDVRSGTASAVLANPTGGTADVVKSGCGTATLTGNNTLMGTICLTTPPPGPRCSSPRCGEGNLPVGGFGRVCNRCRTRLGDRGLRSQYSLLWGLLGSA